jgi:tetratricopeptide (TPR) repeat protein
MYLPLASVVALTLLGVYAVLGEGRRARRTAAVGIVAAVLLGALTIERNRVYASDETLWEDTVAKQPANARAQNNYAVDLLKVGRVADAESHARAAVALEPRMDEAQQTLGVALLSLGRLDEGIASLERARALDPENGKTHQNLGEAYGAKGDLRGALREFLEAARLMPDDAFVLNRAGWILATSADPSLRDGARAVTLASHAVDVTARGDVTSLDTLAAAYAEVNDFDRAVAAAGEALAVAQRTGAAAMLPELQDRLSLYRQRRPFRA